jgi:hypothetical protein
MPVARQWLSSHHVIATTDTHATIEELPVSQSRESLQAFGVLEAGDSLGTQRKGNICCWKPLPSCSVKIMTDITSLYVIVICKVLSRVVCLCVQ